MTTNERHQYPHHLECPYIPELGLIDERLKKQKSLLVQFSKSESYPDELLSALDTYCQKYGTRLKIRFYGHYFQQFDFNILNRIPHVQNLRIDIDSTSTYKNIDTFSELQHLKILDFGFCHLKHIDIFQSENLTKLTELSVFGTKTKTLDLGFLRKCKDLTYLHIEGHKKNVDVVGELHKLEALSLRSLPDFSLDFVNYLKKLQSLSIFLGGRKNIDEIKTLGIKTLGIGFVRGFCQLSNISRFQQLERLWVSDCIQLEELHFDATLPELQYVLIDNCKKLHSLTGMANLKKLQILNITQTDIEFDSLIEQKLSKTLKSIFFRTKTRKRNDEIEQLLLEKGYKSEWLVRDQAFERKI